jgi:hypothetical protein
VSPDLKWDKAEEMDMNNLEAERSKKVASEARSLGDDTSRRDLVMHTAARTRSSYRAGCLRMV